MLLLLLLHVMSLELRYLVSLSLVSLSIDPLLLRLHVMSLELRHLVSLSLVSVTYQSFSCSRM